MITKLIFILACDSISAAIYTEVVPLDNGVEGNPQVQCGSSQIAINFNTKNPFEGHVFVKGFFAEDSCRSDQGGTRVAGISLPLNACRVRRVRSVNPRGVLVSTTIVISFHPHFITKIDRAYTIQCFYMEADKLVSAGLEVSMLTTVLRTEVVGMPVCRYQILDGGPSGPPIVYATVGQLVYHKWTCDTEAIDTFCMRVHSCRVDDGKADHVDLLDENGCALDRYLLQNLQYPSDLIAGRDTNVFKYADKPQLFFQCQITVTVKEANVPCPRPHCSDPQRGRRNVENDPLTEIGTFEVETNVAAMELDDGEVGMENLNPTYLHSQFYTPDSGENGEQIPVNVCISAVALMVIASCALVVLGFIILGVFCRKRRF